jgi:hypothetical protein
MATTAEQKVPTITLIAELFHKLSGRYIDADEFDYLYDQDMEDLANHVEQLKFKLDFHNFITNLTKG